MLFTISLSHLIFSISFYSPISLVLSWHGSSKFDENDSKLYSNDHLNKTGTWVNSIDKSDLEELLNLKHQYILKNHIDDYETHFALHFTPNWEKVDRYSSPVRQSVKIRRQKWEYILNHFNESHAIARLNLELKKAEINRTTFCKDIAEIYFVLSDNAYIFDKEPNSDKKHKYFEFVRNPLHEKSVRAFMNSVSNSKLVWSKKDEIVQLPKSLYIDLMRKDVHIAVVKKHHKDQMQRLKKAYRRRVQQARYVDSNTFVDSEISSY